VNLNDQRTTVLAVHDMRDALLRIEETLDYLRGRVDDPAALAALHDLLIYRALDEVEKMAALTTSELNSAIDQAYRLGAQDALAGADGAAAA
jgi:hypothetical protein